MNSDNNQILKPLHFVSINSIALEFAKHISSHFEDIVQVLLEYESFEVAEDEIAKTLDLFRNLHENQDYFVLRINEVASFLPKNQPLYAFSCFVIIPSLMAHKVHFRIPHSMRVFFKQLLLVLKVEDFFPNIVISKKERLEFLKERTALKIDPTKNDSIPVTDAVIFTGTPYHAEKLLNIFDQRTLFITNGAGHNPIVVAEGSDVQKAVEATIKLQFFNSGQDCGSPNSILVHQNIYPNFLKLLRLELAKVKIGNYNDRSCRICPISETEDLKRINSLIIDNLEWLDESTRGIIRITEAIIEPAIICKPLKEGGNYTEVFAPIIFVQKYEQDDELSLYFETQQYARNAMYVTLYGVSEYINNLIGKNIYGKILHYKDTFLNNIHLHTEGVERGTQPYGGYGYFASSIRINGKVIPKPTCPQRDIYEHIMKPLITQNKVEERIEAINRMTEIETKNVSKLLSLKLNSDVEQKENSKSKTYIDLSGIKNNKMRYWELSQKSTFSLLNYQNAEFISKISSEEIIEVQNLRKFLINYTELVPLGIEQFLYSQSKIKNLSDSENRSRQLRFFKNVYQLLFNKEFGPKLAQFFIDADRKIICELLNVPMPQIKLTTN